MQTLSPSAALAVKSLSSWGPISRPEAAELLKSWKHRNTLTPADVRAVLSHFRARGGAR